MSIMKKDHMAPELVCKGNKYPEKELLREFFWLFEDDYDGLNETFKDVIRLEGNEEFSKKIFNNHKKEFNSYESFVESVVKELED